MAWAKCAVGGYLQSAPLSLPSNHWAQVDVWIPDFALTACDGDLYGASAYLLFLADAILLRDQAVPTGDWQLESDYGAVATAGFSTNATHTIKYHFNSGAVDWYLDGIHVLTDAGVSISSDRLALGRSGEGCACELYFFTNAKVGTSDGAGDILSDDFSSGLAAWTLIEQNGGAVAAVSDPGGVCASISLSGQSGGPLQTLHLTGAGFAPGAPVVLTFGGIPIDFSESNADSLGNVDGTFVVPRLPATSLGVAYDVFLTDDEANVGVTSFLMCWDKAGDGVNTVPDPVLKQAGIESSGIVVGYIHHDGAHWIAWTDGSGAGSTFPPPANRTLMLTMVSEDGAVVIDYELDTDYAWGFSSGGNHFLSGGRWSQSIFFTSWSKPVLDVKLASDGTTLWVAILTAESVIYPYLSADDGDGTYPSQLAQFVDLATRTSGYTSFKTNISTGYQHFFHDTVGPLNIYSPDFPTSDGGDHNFGYWSPPRVVVFAGDAGGFSRIGEMDAQFCPGSTTGYGYANGAGNIISVPKRSQKAPRGSFFSDVSLAASDAEPGVCHLVWSEGGDYGQCGRGSGATPDVWDGGPANRGYRLGYSKWDATSKLSEVDLASATFDRTSWWFAYDEGIGVAEVGYSLPFLPDLPATPVHGVRNDSGSPVLFVAWPLIDQNPNDVPPDSSGHPWLDATAVLTEPTVRMYDISSGSAVLLQTITPDLLPTEAETDFLNPLGTPPQAPDRLLGGLLGAGGVVLDRAFALSFLYEDPLIDGDPVYLLAVPWCHSQDQTAPLRSFYRVRADGSTPFEYLDGLRQLDFSILPERTDLGPIFGSRDFYSDPGNIWFPNSLYIVSGFSSAWGIQFDRKCANAWLPYTLVPAAPGYTATGWAQNSPGGDFGFFHDPDSDILTYIAFPEPFEGGGPLFAVTDLHLCRNCAPCNCAQGLHVWNRL